MSKIIFTGLESSGKSLRLAMVVVSVVKRNSKWLKESGEVRPIYSNMKFDSQFEQYAKGLGVPLKYWSNLDELIEIDNCDVIIDEVGNYFDSRMWADLSLDVRRWLTQGAKSGIEIYGSAQDFAQVDKSFRRLVNQLYEIIKVIGSSRPSPTKPPVKRVWGLCAVKTLDPRGYEEDKKRSLSGIPSFFTIQKKYCEIFDTTQKIVKSKPPPLIHIERECGYPNCNYHKITHI